MYVCIYADMYRYQLLALCWLRSPSPSILDARVPTKANLLGQLGPHLPRLSPQRILEVLRATAKISSSRALEDTFRSLTLRGRGLSKWVQVGPQVVLEVR